LVNAQARDSMRGDDTIFFVLFVDFVHFVA
jgi:hypothetical protein